MKHRNNMITLLNQTYQSNILELSKQELAYRKMVDTHPPRFLSSFTYGEDPQPLRSQRVAVTPVETDVKQFFKSFFIFNSKRREIFFKQ